ncbi:thiD [Wigglesworthia glossinidia endosymbiont of Glossina brevipalpis]|uniref:hydroxymethylpyrimidine kinase n=1 Tax=Wigglesworthia glossinidia brevipalpis TaxID=36870 RepID=Q8D2N6_WIGBR|nr:thiD [Wigglesworthia glossinidia endosymbiont of Glossina brevipalpis]
MKKIYKILSIAGTDPTCGAGIQCDLKTFSALGAYGLTVITSLVSQNTKGVQSIYKLPINVIKSQINSVFSDVKIDSIKIGMLYDSAIIETIYKEIKKYYIPWIILDPVMSSKDGSCLLKKRSINKIKKLLFPISSIVTPNLKESSLILNCSIAKNESQLKEQGKAILEYGCNMVLMKGGHLKNNKESSDWLISKNKEIKFKGVRINTKNTHGTGCSLSSAIAALMPKFCNWEETIKKSKSWLEMSIYKSNKLNIGKGIGPIHHFYNLWKNIY